MKRIIAIFLVVVTVLSSVLTLNGCGATTEEDALTMGQWLTYVADSFGLQNYTSEEPYFKKIDKKNSFFSVFQSSAEWNIIKPSDEITPDTALTWNDVMISLVNAGEFLGEDATDEEKIDYAIRNFDSSVRKYWGKRYIKLKQAIPLLDKAQELWVGKEFTKKIEKAEFSDEVVNLIEDKDLKYTSMENKIIIPESEGANLNVGDIYTLPGNANHNASINKIKSVENIDGNLVITNDDSFTEDEASQYVGEVIIQETSSPDFTQISGIYDQNGNPIAVEAGDVANVDNMNSTSWMNAKVTPLTYTKKQEDVDVIPTGIFDNAKGSLKFTVDKWEVAITTTKDSFSVKLARTLDKAQNRYRQETSEAFLQTTFDDVKLTKDVDFSWGKLHSATVKLDYKTTIEGGITVERENSVGKDTPEGSGTSQTLKSIVSGYKNALSTITQGVNNSKYSESEIYICKLALANGGIASVDFVVKGKVTASGELKLVIEVESAQGIQYKNGNIRYIKSKDVDVNFVAEGKLEITIGPGLEIAILEKWVLINLSVDLGAGVTLEMTAHLLDIEGHQLYSGPAEINADDAEELASEKSYTTAEEINAFAMEQGGTWSNYENQKGQSIEVVRGACFEWKLYPIVRFGLNGKSLVNDLAKKFGVSLSIEILGSKNTLLKGHIDGFTNFSNMVNSSNVLEGLGALLGIGAECIYDFKPWDNAVEEADKLDDEMNVEQKELSITENIVLSTFRVSLSVGQTAEITITGLPKGYDFKDIEAKSEDKKIANIDVKKGIITAGDECGTTQIVVSTKDGKYKAYCAVTVSEDVGVEFEGIAL